MSKTVEIYSFKAIIQGEIFINIPDLDRYISMVIYRTLTEIQQSSWELYPWTQSLSR